MERHKSEQLTSPLKLIIRRLVPLYWRWRLRQGLDNLNRKGRTHFTSPPPRVLWNTKFPDVFIFAGFDGRREGNDLSAGETIIDGRRVFHFFPSQQIASSSGDKIASLIHTVIQGQFVEEAVCVVQHPVWEPSVQSLKEQYGWKIVIDAGVFSRADNTSVPEWLPASKRLLGISDLTVAAWDLHHIPWSDIEALYDKTGIIIVSYNGLELIQQCIHSILERTIYPNYEIVVVDNNSVDEVKVYLARLQQLERRVRVVFNDTNKGFAAANNIGLEYAGDCRYVVLLNNDTVVPRGWLCRLLRHARQPEVGMVGPVTNWTGNEAKLDVSYSDVKDMEAFAQAHTHAHEGSVFDISVLAMYCVAMRKAVIGQIGPLDERFGVGMFEDDDYARRVRQAGYRVICAEDVFVHHQGMASFAKLGESEYRSLFERNRRLYEEKWGEPWMPYVRRQRIS